MQHATPCASEGVKSLPALPTWTTTASLAQDLLEERGPKPTDPPDSVTHLPPTDQTTDQPTSIGAHAVGVIQRRQRNSNATDPTGKPAWARDAVSLNGISFENSSKLVKPASSFLDDAAPKGGTMAFEPERASSRETWPIPAIDSFRSAPKNAPTDRLIVVGPRLTVDGGHTGRTAGGTGRSGGRRSCTSMVLFLFAATLLMIDVVGAVFTPADKAALKDAVGTCTRQGVCTGGCLGETPDGSCPIFAASNVPGTGNPYGVIGDWDVSAVTNMNSSKCTLLLLLCVLNIRQLEFHRITILTHFVILCLCF
jgi:hypothetical protein